jgi:hypothetical protein
MLQCGKAAPKRGAQWRGAQQLRRGSPLAAAKDLRDFRS